MAKTTLYHYNITKGQIYGPNQNIIRMDKCNGFTVVNTGDSIAIVNGFILYPGVVGTSIGDSISFGGNAGEIYMGTIDYSFPTPGANPQITVSQKVYLFQTKNQDIYE